MGYFEVPDLISDVEFKIWVEIQDGRQRPFLITKYSREGIGNFVT